MKIKHTILVLLMLMVSSTAFSQHLKGKVLNTFSQPLESAYVFNVTTKSHAHSSENGLFTIDNTSVGDSLKIGLLGYETKFVVVSSSSFEATLLITLQEKAFQLDEMIITEELNTASTITRLDMNTNPLNSSQEALRKVPGLIIGQHAGGGKAEQIFLRGFDIDHGTDVSINVDGMPVTWCLMRMDKVIVTYIF